MRQDHRQHASQDGTALTADHPAYVPSISTEEVFRKLITDEIQSGRWNTARGKEIAGYATQFGLSSAQAERIIASCMDSEMPAGQSEEPCDTDAWADGQSPRLLKPIVYMVAGVFLILLDLVILKWFR